MVTSLDGVDDKIRGLEAGADDFLSKPVSDLQLLSRVKSLARLKLVSDELFQRTGTVADAEVETLLASKMGGNYADKDEVARILIVDEDELAAARLRLILGETYRVDVASDANTALIRAIDTDYDSIVVSANFTYYDPAAPLFAVAKPLNAQGWCRSFSLFGKMRARSWCVRWSLA